MKTTFFILALLASLALAVGNVRAAQITLSLVQQESSITVTGDFGGLPLRTQEGTPGTTDLNPARPSNSTTYQGTITVNVDNVMMPTSIQILSSAADADVGGVWLPEQYLDQMDLNGNGDPYEVGLPPDGDSRTASSDPPAPAFDADYGVEVRDPFTGTVDIAYGAQRDVVYNVTSGVEPVVAGQFNSTSENFEWSSGWFDYWVDPAAGNIRGRAELAGGDNDNVAGTGPSSYIVTPLPDGRKEIRLMIPVNLDDLSDDLNSFYDGQLVATLIVPEPSTLVLFGAATAIAAAFAARRR